mmetsp:Transcript_6972/g.14487  ORF Transcript_6972/g.14487 Transcript_6972/m.14487 type:complete len:665 (-) Transcript_6972:438-2432(-)
MRAIAGGAVSSEVFVEEAPALEIALVQDLANRRVCHLLQFPTVQDAAAACDAHDQLRDALADAPKHSSEVYELRVPNLRAAFPEDLQGAHLRLESGGELRLQVCAVPGQNLENARAAVEHADLRSGDHGATGVGICAVFQQGVCDLGLAANGRHVQSSRHHGAIGQEEAHGIDVTNEGGHLDGQCTILVALVQVRAVDIEELQQRQIPEADCPVEQGCIVEVAVRPQALLQAFLQRLDERHALLQSPHALRILNDVQDVVAIPPSDLALLGMTRPDLHVANALELLIIADADLPAGDQIGGHLRSDGHSHIAEAFRQVLSNLLNGLWLSHLEQWVDHLPDLLHQRILGAVFLLCLPLFTTLLFRLLALFGRRGNEETGLVSIGVGWPHGLDLGLARKVLEIDLHPTQLVGVTGGAQGIGQLLFQDLQAHVFPVLREKFPHGAAQIEVGAGLQEAHEVWEASGLLAVVGYGGVLGITLEELQGWDARLGQVLPWYIIIIAVHDGDDEIIKPVGGLCQLVPIWLHLPRRWTPIRRDDQEDVCFGVQHQLLECVGGDDGEAEVEWVHVARRCRCGLLLRLIAFSAERLRLLALGWVVADLALLATPTATGHVYVPNVASHADRLSLQHHLAQLHDGLAANANGSAIGICAVVLVLARGASEEVAAVV